MKWLLKILFSIFPFLKEKQKSGNGVGMAKSNDAVQIESPEKQILSPRSPKQQVQFAGSGSTLKIEDRNIQGKSTSDRKLGYSEIVINEARPTQSAENWSLQRIKPSTRPFKESLTGGILESLFSTKRRVGYRPSAKFYQSKLASFPYVLMPEYNTVIKPPINGKVANKGMTEESFCRDYLMKYFKGRVFDSLTVFLGSSPMEPDLSFIDIESGKNIFIDIEIDEPYDGVNRTPTHYLDPHTGKTSDYHRNMGFIERGWIVIRFAEEQIVSTPEGCCKLIGQVIKSIWPEFHSEVLNKAETLSETKMWTKDEAIKMAREKRREEYLGVTTFFPSETTRYYQIKDSQLGKSIENELMSNKSNDVVGAGTKHVSNSSISPTVNRPSPSNVSPPIIVPVTQNPEEPRITKKEDSPSRPAPQTYGS